jgi:hypothetical protein
MEVNEIFPPNIHFEVVFDPKHSWNEDHFFGCSLRAAYDFLQSSNYVLICLEFNNAFFADKARLKNLNLGQTINQAYEKGYKGRAERFDYFPWNIDVEFSETWSFEEVRAHFDRVISFSQQNYILRIMDGPVVKHELLDSAEVKDKHEQEGNQE